jgi:hypothetical protein
MAKKIDLTGVKWPKEDPQYEVLEEAESNCSGTRVIYTNWWVQHLVCGTRLKVRTQSIRKEVKITCSTCDIIHDGSIICAKKYKFKVLGDAQKYESGVLTKQVKCLDCGYEFIISRMALRQKEINIECPCCERNKYIGFEWENQDRRFRVIEHLENKTEPSGREKDRYLVKCLRCGTKKEVVLDSIIEKRRVFCDECDRINAGDIWYKYEVLGDFIEENNHRKYWVKCLDCGYKFTLFHSTILRKAKSRCPNCDVFHNGYTWLVNGRQYTVVGERYKRGTKLCFDVECGDCKSVFSMSRTAVKENLRGKCPVCDVFNVGIGFVSGRLIVIDNSEIRPFTQSNRTYNTEFWPCQCSCENDEVLWYPTWILGARRVLSCGCLQRDACRALCGPKSGAWKGGITPLAERIRKSDEYSIWRKEVLERDRYTCQYSNLQGVDFEVHHIRPFFQIILENNITTWDEARNCKELWDVSNGITLAKEFHSITSDNALAFHKIYSNANFTQQNFRDWFMQI